MTLLLPKWVTSFPEKGIIRNWPTGRANRILPSIASFRCSAVLISGILLAQDAKQSPMLK
jgi:hypothetical protein